jgi:predicted ATPase
LQLLRHVAQSQQSAKMMILGTYRDSDLAANNPLSDMLASLRREGDVQRIDLVGLDDLEVIEMMEAAAGHEMPEDGVALAHAVRQETEGNPFFTAEMLMHLGESGLVRQDETGHWVATDDLYQQGLPQSVREVVGQRIDRLGDEHRGVLSQASVIGRDFDLELLAIVTDIDEDHLLDLLDQARAAGLVHEIESTVDRFSFTHALTQHTLYDDLGASRRARAHRKIAEALESLCGATPQARAGELARHFVAATKTADIVKALAYTQMAGNQALAQLAPADALSWFTQALDLYDQGPSDETLHCDLLIGLGTAQRQTGDPAHRETLLQAANIAKRLGDSDRLALAALASNRGSASVAGQVDRERVAVLEDALDAIGSADSATRARLLAMVAVELSYSGQRERIATLIDESMAMARRLDDPLAFLRVANAYGAIPLPENLDARLVDLSEALSTAAAIGDPTASFQANYSRALACFQAGDRGALETHLDACASLAEQLDQLFERWVVTTTRAELSVVSGDLDAAEELANDALTIGADSVPEALTTWGGLLLEVRDVQGRLGEMVEVLNKPPSRTPASRSCAPRSAGSIANWTARPTRLLSSRRTSPTTSPSSHTTTRGSPPWL